VIDEVEKTYGTRGLTVVAVNEDGPRNLSRIRPFLRSRRLDFHVLLDLNSAVMNAYRIDSIPTTILVDPSGEIVYFHKGYKPGDEEYLRREIDKLLR
jgi:hypothetical protein